MKINSESVSQTIKIGQAIAKSLRNGDIICLFGELGSGKTILTKGIACGLGILKQEVISPTFVLVRQYNHGRLPLYHFDLYRLKLTKDILALGYEEYLYGQGVSVIEWPDRLSHLTPAEYLKVDLKIVSESLRSLEFSARGIRYKKLLGEIDENIRH